MKIKTWEKIYWGLDIAWMMLLLVGYKMRPESYTIETNGVKRIMTWGEVILGTFIIYVVVAGLIWLIIRYFVNKDEKN